MSSDQLVEMAPAATPAPSTPLAISADGLGKLYRLGATTGGYHTLREDISSRLLRRGPVAREREFWALRDVSFDVREGEILGIIGRNGAGKSTLLKLLSRITAPTEGHAVIRGRVGSLLEVGTGFHQELSGRENILLNGAILGMGRKEIARKTEEIVDFSGVERFLDTPVKRYSSGMYLRLAFAVAAHLEPDILLVDEVLAVGDAEFQRKCLGRMSEVSASGRTVLFISHSMPAVLRLCSRLLLLDGGRIIEDGPASEVVRTYLDTGLGSIAERRWPADATAPGDDDVRLRGVRAVRSDGASTEEFDVRERVGIEVSYDYLGDPGQLRPSVYVGFRNDEGVYLFHSHDFVNPQWKATPRKPGAVTATCWLPGNFLAEGRHLVTVGASSYEPTRVHFEEHEVVTIQMVDRSRGDGVRGDWVGDWPGVVRPMLQWDVQAGD